MKRILSEGYVVPVECDACGDGSTEVTVARESDFVGLVMDLDAEHIGWDPGRPRGAYGDPTFVRAAQRIAVQERLS